MKKQIKVVKSKIAKKVYRCYCCRRKIAVGEPYYGMDDLKKLCSREECQ